jgi:hypothetical protein
MRVLGSAVIAMESILVGFALLLAMDNHGALALALGGALAIAMLLCAGMMKNIRGWIFGSLLQIALISYGVVVTPMYFMGALFTALWAAAYFLGRRGEAIRAELLANGPIKP